MGIGSVEEVVSYYYHFLEVGVKVRCTDFSTKPIWFMRLLQLQQLLFYVIVSMAAMKFVMMFRKNRITRRRCPGDMTMSLVSAIILKRL